MNDVLTRSSALLRGLCACVAGAVLSATPAWAADVSPQQALYQQLSDLEQEAHGRLGVVLVDTADGSRFAYRGDERFPFCSTSKVMAVAAILKRSETEPDLLTRSIDIRQADLVNYNPIAEKHVGGSMTLSELSAAALQYSDNVAMNKLIEQLGGPAAVTRFSRQIGDSLFRLDRTEPMLNSAIPGDERDTTTPAAMAESLRKLTLGDALKPAQRAQLVTWLKGNTTGATSIRAGLPSSWTEGDKTGNGRYGTTNDIAVIWPPGHQPLVLAIYFTQPDPKAPARRDVLAKAAGIVTQAYR